MKRFLILGFIASLGALGGCQTFQTKIDAFPNMYEEQPLSILVLPAINNSTSAEATDYYKTTIAEPLSFSGYYIFPIELVSDVFKQEGIQDTAALANTDPRKFGEAFGADAVLYVTINKWDTNYYVVGGNVKVDVSFLLKSTKTGSPLWSYSDELTVDTTSNSSGGGLIGLAVNMVATAVSTAMTDYVPIAKKVNYMALSSMPMGKYNKDFMKDKEWKAVNVDKEKGG